MDVKTISLISFLFLSILCYAQPGNPSTPAPIGFIEVLLGTGVAYGVKSSYHNKKK